MLEIVFPNNQVNHRYYKRHASFIFNQAKLAGLAAEYIPHNNDVWFKPGILSILVDGFPVRINYEDLIELPDYDPNVLYFKFHYNRDKHKGYTNVFPLCPGIIFPGEIESYQRFYSLVEKDLYRPKIFEKVINKQRAYGMAQTRRKYIQSELTTHYDDYNSRFLSQEKYWNALTECLVAVHAPGAREDMIDRALMEHFGLGVCTISPFITDVLSGYRNLIPGEHYVQCRYDYQDMIEKIEWCRNNRLKCEEIGAAAKTLFKEVYPPDKYWQWIEKVTKQFYKE